MSGFLPVYVRSNITITFSILTSTKTWQDTVTRLQAVEQRILGSIPDNVRYISLQKKSRSFLAPKQPPIQWLPKIGVRQ